ncbi:MAG: type I 3-dehydroquinate dehydratase, partial [Phycisphaeraceae bacterium]
MTRMTSLAVSIMVESLPQALGAAARAAELGADLVELRIDRFTESPDQVSALIERVALPCVITCRPRWEGGDYDGDEQRRYSLLEQAAMGVRTSAYIDVELAAYQQSADLRQRIEHVVDHPVQVRPTTTGLILSSHDFAGRPID